MKQFHIRLPQIPPMWPDGVTVAELIAALQKLPQNYHVRVSCPSEADVDRAVVDTYWRGHADANEPCVIISGLRDRECDN